MADTHAKDHDYHLVEPSPWPALGALSALVLAAGLIMYMHDMTIWVLPIGLAMTLYTMFVWWRDVIQEATFNDDHTPVVQLGLRYGMVLFIASEVMFFVAWFWAFFNASLFPTEAIGGVWPPADIEAFNPWTIPFLNTIILLSSGCTVTWAHHELRQGNRQGLINGLWLTVILGAAFTALQAYEYIHAPFAFTGGIYGSTFFMATGFHGLHVIVGTIFLTVCLVRAYKGHFTPEQHFGFEAAAWYWHFVDVVWLFLFSCIYWWGGS
ncbi:MAG TPA: cytochrome c oxidase subunit 3 [Alphaproteobacteria bacterium]|jgi:cytochrome c oxidase subunit 3|nr:cytochrome c oxidase subunit 3 [Alphaproteobacteria bacterium]MDP6270142.1 cytochrome c oxidase subunit 3 [Alphaproteobacteria bacterium]MDP7427264.1 cytochrome c oxidase subunit 3 [Alphaproteobacteria bacterium]HJM49766.1 cytochrome c oxidase subunit 3 [Alphaproteobacteria bacterium]